jgi:hypothetical protein
MFGLLILNEEISMPEAVIVKLIAMIPAVLWVVFAIVALAVFKGPIRERIRGLSRVKAGGVELGFLPLLERAAEEGQSGEGEAGSEAGSDSQEPAASLQPVTAAQRLHVLPTQRHTSRVGEYYGLTIFHVATDLLLPFSGGLA